MSQYLNEVLDELKRFNPNARVASPVVVSGVSPATEVVIEADETKTVQALRDEIEQLERENSRLSRCEDELCELHSDISRILSSDDLEASEALEQIKELI